jgi:hypothetical protein
MTFFLAFAIYASTYFIETNQKFIDYNRTTATPASTTAPESIVPMSTFITLLTTSNFITTMDIYTSNIPLTTTIPFPYTTAKFLSTDVACESVLGYCPCSYDDNCNCNCFTDNLTTKIIELKILKPSVCKKKNN